MNEQGTLYLVATPIGNLEDWTQRAERILGEVDLIAAEDTRVTRRLLAAKGLNAQLTSYYEGADEKRSRKRILDALQAGKNVALVSDAGSPGISDPGYPLVTEAIALGLRVVPVPGACAVIAALQIAGCPTDRFAFFGFLPRKGKGRENALDRIESWAGTAVLYESPKRLAETMADLAGRFPEKRGAVCREMTKLYEEAVRGTMSELAAFYQDREVRGEVVIVADLSGEETADESGALRKAMEVKLAFRLSDKDAAGIASAFMGVSKNRIYKGLIKEKELT